jgi:hypothetical protein
MKLHADTITTGTWNKLIVSSTNLPLYRSKKNGSLIGLDVGMTYCPRDPEDVIFDNAAFTWANLASGLHIIHITGLNPSKNHSITFDVITNYEYVPSLSFNNLAQLRLGPQLSPQT